MVGVDVKEIEGHLKEVARSHIGALALLRSARRGTIQNWQGVLVLSSAAIQWPDTFTYQGSTNCLMHPFAQRCLGTCKKTHPDRQLEKYGSYLESIRGLDGSCFRFEMHIDGKEDAAEFENIKNTDQQHVHDNLNRSY